MLFYKVEDGDIISEIEINDYNDKKELDLILIDNFEFNSIDDFEISIVEDEVMIELNDCEYLINKRYDWWV